MGWKSHIQPWHTVRRQAKKLTTNHCNIIWHTESICFALQFKSYCQQPLYAKT